MAGSLSEKPDDSISQAPSHDAATNDAASTRDEKIKDIPAQAIKYQPVKKLDSHIVKPNAKDEDTYAHLPSTEADILKRQVDIPTVKVGWMILYRYATKTDRLIIAVSAVSSIVAGAAMPLMTVIYGQLAGKFKGFFSGEFSHSSFHHTVDHMVLYLIYIGIAEFITIYISMVGFIYTGEHISGKLRARYLEACMRQNIGFFDKLGSGEVTTRITADTNLVQDGISEKVALTLNASAMFITAFAVGFIKSWKLTLIASASVVAITVIVGGGSSFIVKYNKESLQSYAEGGTVAEEALSSIRNATAFGTQEKLARQYDNYLTSAERWGFKHKFTFALMVGAIHMAIYCQYGLCFWIGSKFLVKGEIALSSILTILMSVMIGAFALGNVAPNVQAFTTAISAAGKIFNTIDRVSPLDPFSDAGEKLPNVEGTIELKHIKHIYPSRPEVTVMDDISLIIPAGKQTALVGASGSAKSTIVGLVERFYDPVGGQVLLDGHDISTLNLRWWRQQISLVGQEPTLFGTTIFENIAHGLIGTRFESETGDIRIERVIQAAKTANAHDFISALPNRYETNVGERGFLLSGGQKQRVAIARAMISDPKILLLDEATSALDTRSEGIVQAALEVAAVGRTTITIAHRLSTIKDADNIVVMAEGRVVEQGTHDELLMKEGAYYYLVEAQKIAEAERMNPENEAHIDAEDDILAKEHFLRDDLSVPEDDAGDKNIGTKSNHLQSEKAPNPLVNPELRAEAVVEYSLWTLIKLIASFNSKEWYWMVIGLVFSVLCGGGNPTQEVFAAKQIVSLSIPFVNPVTGRPIPGAKSRLRSDVDFWSLMYLMLAFVQLITFWVQGVAFAFCSERLIHRLRYQAFRTMLRQDIAFFDKEQNTAGALTSFLSTGTTHVAGLSGVTLGTILIVLTTLVSACALAIAIAWKLALVCIATIPVLLACGFFRFRLLAQFQRRAQKAYEKSASYACEATGAMRTVASLTREYDVLKQYEDILNSQAKKNLHSVLESSLLYSASQSLMFLCIGLGFWYGAKQIIDGKYDMFQFFVCFSAVIFGANSAGTVFSFAPDMGKAKEAAQQLKTLFDLKPPIDSWSPSGHPLPSISGHIEFRSVHFRYPTRRSQSVLRGLSLSVKPGQYIALVGASGCGKSTTISLLERFYDPLSGGIYVDGKDISTLNLRDYRSFIALVDQEPTLYQGSILENILLGTAREASDIPFGSIEHACREANIYDFVTCLPDGFATIVGSKGSMLSGGQKQRIAIARALIRDPKILLLDEATSALDSESETVVQTALDKAAKGRTTIAIAHRLSTIQKADVIYVMDQGVIVEKGDHTSLMRKGGKYAELVRLQSLGSG